MNAKRRLLSLVLIFVLGISAAAAQEATPEPMLQQMGATAFLQDVDGNEVGQVTFSERGDGKVVVVGMFAGLEPGFHGLHIHETATCDPSGDEPFSSAGGHLNLSEAVHPDHTGDLPSVLINADGTGEIMVVTDRFALSDLMDADGSAAMIHSSDDNFAHIPERYGTPDEATLRGGDSGSRVACGAIEQDAGMTSG